MENNVSATQWALKKKKADILAAMSSSVNHLTDV